MIILRDISLRRGPRLLFENAHASLLPGQNIALTGANGCGKSSLFAMLLGEVGADAGHIEGLDGQRVAHMAQDTPASAMPASEFVLAGDEQVATLLTELKEREASEDFEAVARTHQALEACDGYSAPRRVAQLLLGLGFEADDGKRALADFSGGWRVRLALARALMTPSDLLLLDEPTNHLDIDAILWLQEFLRRYSGTLLVISHDRDFIDACCTGVLHIERCALTAYRGGYSDFETQRAQRLAEQRASADKQARRRAEIEDFVRRFRAKATKAKQAQSRLKELERMGSASTAHIDSPFEFRFPAPPRGRDPLVELRAARIGHSSGSPLITSCDLALRSGERFALLGRNGAGKTTLLRSLCGDLPLLDGERHSSDGCRIAYFDQQQVDTLDLEASALLHLQRLSPEAREQELRDFLGGFDFRGDRAEAPLAPFSGGEKARLALALLAWQRPNVLILDEPTNHLDLEMRRALELALLDFAGALVLVSHDRHLLRSTADRLLLLADGRLEEFEGDISAYEAHILGAPAESRHKPDAPEQRNEADRRDQRRAAAAARAQRRPLQREIEKLESAIEEQQSALARLETTLAEPELYGSEAKTRLQGLLQEQGERRQRLSKLEEDWLSRQEALEALSD
ncbi:MAG: ATP-binding cassette domain-containing protein [Pseudomonadota bacterium]